MDIAIGLIKLALLIFAYLLVPVAALLATPFILLWPRAATVRWEEAVLSRYGKVIRVLFTAVEILTAAIPD